MTTPSPTQVLKWLKWIEENAHLAGFEPTPNYHKDYYLEYCEHVQPLVESGELFNPNRSNIPWNKFNSRSPWSVLGTAEELYQIKQFNNYSDTTKMYRADSSKEDEMRGEDSCVYNINWANPYRVQAKHGDTSWAGIMQAPQSWFKYDTDFLHRICISNYAKQWAIMMDYGAFREFVQKQYQLKGDVTYHYYEVPIVDLQRKKDLLRYFSF